MLTYDDQGRAYWDGERVPRTTEICAILAPRWQADKYYLQRGIFGHLITQWEDTGELDESSVDPLLQGYLAGYRRFKRESHWIPLGHEIQFYHLKYGYCGRVDMRGYFENIFWLWIIDKKLGQPHESDTLQSPAYLFGLLSQNILVQKCGDLYLKPNGTYRFKEIKNPTDKFLKFLEGVKQWQTEQKLK